MCGAAWSGEIDTPGTLHGAAALGVSGQVGGALSLPSEGSYLEVPDSDAIDAGTSDFSVAFWIKTTDGFATVMEKRDDAFGVIGYSVFVDPSTVGIQLADGTHHNYTAAASVADGEWHHVAISVDRDQTDGLKFYVDGALLEAQNPTGKTGDLSNDAPLLLGEHVAGGTGGTIGMLDQIYFYKRSITLAEVQTLAAGQHVDSVACD